ncbi:paired amphipathic helix [Schizophyllum fasciatum]
MSPPPPSPPPGAEIDVADALSYLDAVKDRFRDRPEAYKQFLEVLKSYKAKIIDIRQCVERVVEMFRGNPDLIVGFNVFLPRGAILDPVSNTGTVVQLP